MTNKIWLKHYPSYIPAEINADQFSSIAEMFAQSCKKFSKKIAMSNMGSSMTYEELLVGSTKLSTYFLHTLKLNKGDKVALMMPNIMQYCVALFGALQAGLIVVNINPLYTPREVISVLKDAEVETVVVLENFAHTLEMALPETSVKHVIITQMGDLFPTIKKYFINFAIKNIKKLIKPYKIPQAIWFSKILSTADEKLFQRPNLKGDDVAFLQYTGGTTGIPKAAILTHRNIIANVEQMAAWVKNILKEGEEILIAPLPLYHIFSLTVCAFTFLRLGNQMVLITNPRDIAGFIREIKNIPFTVFIGINTLFHALIAHPLINHLQFKSLRLAISSGMGLHKSIAEEWQHLTGNVILEGYGLTEASPAVTVNLLNTTTFTGSAGMPIPSTDLICLDEEENPVPIGQVGEICVKGPQVMKGYWKQDAETKNAFTADGWLKTGDLGYLDEEGLLYIVDRKKDMIIVSGFNVYPKEIEDIIATHQNVYEVSVIGVPDEHSGEAVKAYIVKKEAALTEEEVLAFCKERLTGYKIPKYIEFCDSLPKSTVGKILRYELKKGVNNNA